MADLCTMCEQAPATTTWGFPVCQPCADNLSDLDAELKAEEREDPYLAELGRRLEEAWLRFISPAADPPWPRFGLFWPWTRRRD